jgi:hypothetical protein
MHAADHQPNSLSKGNILWANGTEGSISLQHVRRKDYDGIERRIRRWVMGACRLYVALRSNPQIEPRQRHHVVKLLGRRGDVVHGRPPRRGHRPRCPAGPTMALQPSPLSAFAQQLLCCGERAEPWLKTQQKDASVTGIREGWTDKN